MQGQQGSYANSDAGEARAPPAPLRRSREPELEQLRGAPRPEAAAEPRCGRAAGRAGLPRKAQTSYTAASVRGGCARDKASGERCPRSTHQAGQGAGPSEPKRAWPCAAGTPRPHRVQQRAGPRCARPQRACDCSGGGALPPQPQSQWPAPQRGAMGNISSNISAFQSLHIVMLGLDSAGKTTVLYRLKFNEFVNTVPTIGFNTEKIKLSNGTAKGISCHFWDVGGQEKLRPLWKSYSRCTDGIIYVVDSVDVDRLEEAKTELHKVTKFAENQGTPLLVIANKQDLPKSLPVAEIEKQLALHELIPATTYHVQPACAIIGEGLTEGMDKLYEMILKRRKSLKQKKKR